MLKRYVLYNRDVPIGMFIEDYTNRVMRLRMEIDLTIPKNLMPLSFPPIMDENGVIDHKGVEFWLSFRVMPPTQQGADEVLEKLGLSEYSALSIFHVLKGRTRRDDMYIGDLLED